MFWVHKLLRCLGLWQLTTTIILIILVVEIVAVKLLQQCCPPCCVSNTHLSTTCSKLRCYHRNVLTSSECDSGLRESSGVLLLLVVHEAMYFVGMRLRFNPSELLLKIPPNLPPRTIRLLQQYSIRLVRYTLVNPYDIFNFRDILSGFSMRKVEPLRVHTFFTRSVYFLTASPQR